MTILEIQTAVRPHKPMSRETVYTYLRRLRIHPVSKMRQRPQRYPEDTPQRILRALGITSTTRRNRAA